MNTLTDTLSSPWSVRSYATGPGSALRQRNAHLMSLMTLVWTLTVLYSGPLGHAIYWTSGRKFWDAFLAETPSFTVMEIVTIGVDLTLAGSAGMGEPLFWNSVIVPLGCGLFAGWPANVLLIHYGVKEGMMDPRNTEHG